MNQLDPEKIKSVKQVEQVKPQDFTSKDVAIGFNKEKLGPECGCYGSDLNKKEIISTILSFDSIEEQKQFFIECFNNILSNKFISKLFTSFSSDWFFEPILTKVIEQVLESKTEKEIDYVITRLVKSLDKSFPKSIDTPSLELDFRSHFQPIDFDESKKAFKAFLDVFFIVNSKKFETCHKEHSDMDIMINPLYLSLFVGFNNMSRFLTLLFQKQNEKLETLIVGLDAEDDYEKISDYYNFDDDTLRILDDDYLFDNLIKVYKYFTKKYNPALYVQDVLMVTSDIDSFMYLDIVSDDVDPEKVQLIDEYILSNLYEKLLEMKYGVDIELFLNLIKELEYLLSHFSP